MQTQHILVIAPTRIGDAVLAASVVRHLHETQPDARITIVTSTLAAPLFEGLPNLERIVTLTKRTYNRHWIAAWRATIGTRWDALWDLRNSILSFTLRARRVHRFTPPKNTEPKVKQYEAILGVKLPFPILWPRPEDTAAARTLMPTGTRYLVLAPIANWAPKEWPMAHFITLAQSLLRGACAGYRPVVICAGHEREKARPLLAALADYHPVDLTDGSAPLLTVYACMQAAHGFIGNDSGLMHMAAAAAIPTLGLFGPTPETIYRPWGEHTGTVVAPNSVLEELSPATVEKRFVTLLQQTAS